MAISDCLKRFRNPIWTSQEVEQLWSVLQQHLSALVNNELRLPDTNIYFTFLDPQNERHKQRCIRSVWKEGKIWKGKYSLAVANIKAVWNFFHKTVSISTVAEQLQELKKVFEQRPLER